MKKRVYQTDTSATSGNCLQACLASFFGCDLNEIPKIPPDENWRQIYTDIIHSKGKKIVCIPVAGTENQFEAFLERNFYEGSVIVSVSSPGLKDKLHAVVAWLSKEGLQIVHDPNPNYDSAKIMYEAHEIDIIF